MDTIWQHRANNTAQDGQRRFNIALADPLAMLYPISYPLSRSISSHARPEDAMRTQLNRGLKRRLMCVENKNGTIDGVNGRIGWVSFSKSGQTVYYRGRELAKAKGGGISGNFFDVATREEYWVSGVKCRGSNTHPAERVSVTVDGDAHAAYRALRASAKA